MSKKSQETAKLLKEKRRLLEKPKTTAYAISESSMESFLLVDPSPPYLANPTPKQYIRKVRHLWVIK